MYPRDPLTDLPVVTRAPGDAVWEAALGPRTGEPERSGLTADAVLVALDLLDLRAVNHSHGFEFGDRLLAEVTGRLRVAAGPWPVFRIGGDEFLVAARLPADGVGHFASALRDAVERPFEGVVVRAQMAAALAFNGESPDQLVEAVDHALTAVTQNRWPEVLIAPAGADGTTWFERPAAATNPS